MKRLVLAFDIERAGASSIYNTIGLGASVIDQEFNEIDFYIYSCVCPLCCHQLKC